MCKGSDARSKSSGSSSATTGVVTDEEMATGN